MENDNLLALAHSTNDEEISPKNKGFNLNNKLMDLLAKRTKAYTMGESTSITIEKAQQLYKSICFSVELYIRKSNNTITIESMDSMLLLKNSWKTIECHIAKAQNLYQLVLGSAIDIGNIAYNDTIVELGKFFKRYDYRFFAHEIPCSIDYQLCQSVQEEIQGIKYITKYLTNLYVENMFCLKFSLGQIVKLLSNYCQDYEGLLINIFEPVLANAIGLTLLEKEARSLDITEIDREQLYSFFQNKEEKELQQLLILASKKLCINLGITQSIEQNYITLGAMDLLPRIMVGVKYKRLTNIFISLVSQEDEETTLFSFIDGQAMDDKSLRNLIAELSECKGFGQKVELVNSSVHSLKDLIEVLNTSFWGDECNYFLETLDEQTIHLLKQYILTSMSQSATGWEKEIKYYNKWE